MVDPLSYLSFQPVLHDWCNKGSGMCCHFCGMMLIRKRKYCNNYILKIILKLLYLSIFAKSVLKIILGLVH